MRPQPLLFTCPLLWPTFHCAVTFDVEDLIEKKKVNLLISKCVYNNVLKIGPAPGWHLCHVASCQINLLKWKRCFKQINIHKHSGRGFPFLIQKIEFWFWETWIITSTAAHNRKIGWDDGWINNNFLKLYVVWMGTIHRRRRDLKLWLISFHQQMEVARLHFL